MTDTFPYKYGVALDESTHEKINRHVDDGDSRSARIRRLVRLGLAFEDVMMDNQYWPPGSDQRERILREATRKYLEEELK